MTACKDCQHTTWGWHNTLITVTAPQHPGKRHVNLLGLSTSLQNQPPGSAFSLQPVLSPTGSEVKSRSRLPPHVLAYIEHGGRPRNDNLKNMQSAAGVGPMMTAIHHWLEGVVLNHQIERIHAPQFIDLPLPVTCSMCKY